MKNNQFPETKFVSNLQRQEAGNCVKDISTEHGISEATIYNWNVKYGEMEGSDVKKMKELEEEKAD
jgi:putative transposase